MMQILLRHTHGVICLEVLLDKYHTAFSESTVGQLKLTAFAAIPTDIEELGPIWIERYVRTLLSESYSFGLEFGFVKGGGTVAKQPIGLTKNVDPETGAVTD